MSDSACTRSTPTYVKCFLLQRVRYLLLFVVYIDIRHPGCTYVRSSKHATSSGSDGREHVFRWYADVSSFPALDSQTEFGPTFKYEYNTRDTYGGNITGWGPSDPLNGTWWHLVSEGQSPPRCSSLIADDDFIARSAMETDSTLVQVCKNVVPVEVTSKF